MVEQTFEPLADNGLSVDNEGNSPNPEQIELESKETTLESTEDIETVEQTEESEKDITQTQAFSKRLSEARAKDLEKIASLEKAVKEKEENEKVFARLKSALNGYGYEGEAFEIADTLEAATRQITPEQLRAEREAQEKALQEAISNNPVVLQAREILRQNETARLNSIINNDLAEIRKLNPEIKTFADLEKHPNSRLIEALVKGGQMSIAQAYKELHEITHTEPKQNIDTKEHLRGVGGGEVGSVDLVDIPSEELATYKKAFPEASAKELKIKYNNALKRQRGE